MEKWYDFTSMTEEEYRSAMQRRMFFRDGEREMGFWRKLMCFLWTLLVALVTLALIGLVPLSANAMAAGTIGIAGIPAALVADYNFNFKKGW